MVNTKVRTLEKINIKALVWFIGLMAVVAIIPHYIHSQWITGPIVNAALFLAVMTIGTANAIAIGLVPSVIALASGLLPAPLAPMIPFIMISNAILVLIFSYFKKMNYWSGVLGGTLFKYAFLYGTSLIVVNLISNQNIAAKAAATMMAWPQIVTALIGGIIAFGITKVIKKA
jgi:hypothetical protein